VAEPRRGYGYACAAGSARALELGADLLVYMDGDGSARPAELPRLLEPLERGAADLVLGSRVLGGAADGALATHQRLGNALSAALMRRLYGIAVTDLGPYRAIRAGLLRELAMLEMTYGWPTEMTVKSARRGARVVEVPVTWETRRGGRSKVSGTVRGSVLAGVYILGVTLRYARR
jgi:glycosyltransferase involved in cell wall biosynthesis